MNKRTKLISLIVIVVIAFVLRFIYLDKNPPALSWDETAQGYNAYALGQTGTDEFGRSWPLNYLESFGDFKPVLNTYLTILPVKVFGLTEFATRFPSAFFGSLTVLLCFYLVIELFYRRQEKDILGLATAFILAVSPWHLLLSRGAYEANIGLFLVVLGGLFLLKGFHGHKLYFLGSVIPFALTFYTFNSTRAFIPFFLLAVFILYRQFIFSHLKLFLLFCLFFIVLLIPIIPHLLSPQANLRFREVNIFSNLKPIEQSNNWIKYDNNSLVAKIVHNRRVIFGLDYLTHYFDHFDLNYLFIHGDVNSKFSIQDTGQIYLINLPLFLIGLIVIFRKYRPESLLLFLWLLTGIIPAATARETPHALRTLQTLPVWHIIIAVGGYYLYSLNLKPFFKKLMVSLYCLYLLFNIGSFLHNYFYHYPEEFAGSFQYGYHESMSHILTNYQNYDQFLITEGLGRPYIYVLFYSRYLPNEFLKTADIQRDVFGFVKVKSFAKYLFGSPPVIANIKDKKILVIALPGEVPPGKKIKKIIKNPRGDEALVIYEN